LDNGSTIFYSSYCPLGKTVFVIGEWWNEVNDMDRYTSPNINVHNSHPRCICLFLLLPIALHGEDLYEANEDIDHIELESDRLPDRVSSDSTRLSHTSVV